MQTDAEIMVKILDMVDKQLRKRIQTEVLPERVSTTSCLLLPPYIQRREYSTQEFFLAVGDSIVGWIPQILMSAPNNQLSSNSALAVTVAIADFIRGDFAQRVDKLELESTSIQEWNTGVIENITGVLYTFSIEINYFPQKEKTPVSTLVQFFKMDPKSQVETLLLEAKKVAQL